MLGLSIKENMHPIW